MRVFRSENRGGMNIGWLDTKYSFSFANWYDPGRMGLGKLRVFNDDKIKPGGKFDMHPHANMEIITVVLKGAVSHEDNMGNKSKIDEGSIQVMSAGTGVIHSEANEEEEELHLFQIWIEPDSKDIEPSYSEQKIDWEGNKGLTKLVTREGEDRTLRINQDATISTLSLADNEDFNFKVGKEKLVFVFIISGNVEIEGISVKEGDSIEIDEEEVCKITALSKTKSLIIEVPK